MNDATNTPAPAAVMVTVQQGEVVAVDPLVVTTQKYTVPEENLPKLNEKLEKISRKAVRLGLPVITLTKVSELDVPFLRTERDLDGELYGENQRFTYRKLDTDELMVDAKRLAAKPNGRHTIVFRKYHVVELTGAVPRLAGWDFVATLQHLEVDGEIANMLRVVPGFEGNLPLKFRDCGPENCDHCKRIIRSRKETFVVRNVETGEWLQVGRNCTQDFLGGKDPHAVASMLELMQRAGELCGSAEEGGFGGGIVERGLMVEFLEWVAACVRIDGWISRGKARMMDGRVQATADQAWNYMFPPRITDAKARAEFNEKRRAHTPTEEDTTLASKSLDYAHDDLKGKAEGNDYLFNLWVACNQEMVIGRISGISASLIAHYIKEVERRTLNEAQMQGVKDGYVGTVGERRFFEVKVLSVKVIGLDSPFGPKNLTHMVTSDGYLLTWFDSTPEPLKTGESYIFKATVKKHEDYRGKKQTVINRPDVYTKEEMEAELVKLAKKAERAAKRALKKSES